MQSRVLIIAEKMDARARKLAAGLGRTAVVVAPCDLSRPGWTFHPDPRKRTGCNGSETFLASELSAVIIRLVAVFPGQILHVARKDREYVAAEMTAFLRAWLCELSCPLINPPIESSLSGPAWENERWAMLAHRVGVPFFSAHLRVPAASDRLPDLNLQQKRRLVVVGDELVAGSECSMELADRARTLVSAAGMFCGAVHFDISEPRAPVISVECRPDLSEPALLDALVRVLAFSRHKVRKARPNPAINSYLKQSTSVFSTRCSS
jgi:hypothetical protein